MNVIIGIVLVLGCVAGGFVLSHGHLASLWQPYELLVIGGAALGAFVIANPGKVIKAVMKNLPALFKGSPYNKAYYLDALALIYDLLTKARKEGMMSLEADVEDPEKSGIFGKYPKVLHNHHAVEFLTDYLRLMVGGSIKNAFELENLMDVELDTHHEEAHQPSAALTRISDGLPGFGIVAAVLGIVITMGHINGPVEEIGHKVGAALVGTFLGILLSYGFFAPMVTKLEFMGHEEIAYFKTIAALIQGFVSDLPPKVCIEMARRGLGSEVRPNPEQMEALLKAVEQAG